MQLIVIAHNIRSTYNVGAILRTADGFGIKKVYLTGYTPYPTQSNDVRLPHLREKITKQIHKTALGAEITVVCEFVAEPLPIIEGLKKQGYTIAALEQTEQSVPLNTYLIPQKMVLLLGEEVHGINEELLDTCDVALEIPMYGQKESFNVSVAAGIAMYALTLKNS